MRPRDAEGRFRREGRSRRGQFTAGAPGPAFRHGKYSALVANGAADGREDELQRIRLDIERGDGTVVREIIARRMATLDALTTHLEDDLQTRGMVTARGRKRAVGDVYLNAVTRILGLADRLGIAPPPERNALNLVNLSDEQIKAQLERMLAGVNERIVKRAAHTVGTVAPTEKPSPFSVTVEE